ncbi:hypothetical protein [Bremerella sp.]|uniref:hypothetical protein n=1 Tax=Bremerella sp. TaxID=2795602 RepID=UPI003919B396
MNTILKPRGVALLACVTMLLAINSIAAAEDPSAKLTDEEKLAIIVAGKEELTRTERIRNFAHEGAFDAVGRLVTIGKTVYFKTADQSYIPEGKRFPYPELLLELHLSETHAYQPLFEQKLTSRNQALYTGPLRIQGNWAYEGAYHIFGVVWVDQATKVAECPEGEWGRWLEMRSTPKKTN